MTDLDQKQVREKCLSGLQQVTIHHSGEVTQESAHTTEQREAMLTAAHFLSYCFGSSLRALSACVSLCIQGRFPGRLEKQTVSYLLSHLSRPLLDSSPSHTVQGPAYKMVPPIFRADLPASNNNQDNLSQTLPRPA